MISISGCVKYKYVLTITYVDHATESTAFGKQKRGGVKYKSLPTIGVSRTAAEDTVFFASMSKNVC
jgi:hypothetical protein